MGSFQASGRFGATEEGEDRKDDKERRDKFEKMRQMGKQRVMKMMHGTRMDTDQGMHGGSDVFGFILGLINGVVGGVKSIIFKTSAGSSSGASKGSQDLASGVVKPLFGGSDGLAAELTT